MAQAGATLTTLGTKPTTDKPTTLYVKQTSLLCDTLIRARLQQSARDG